MLHATVLFLKNGRKSYETVSYSSSTAVGFDVIALILNKKNPKINIALTMYLINTCVLLFGLLSYGITSVLTGIGFTALQSLTLNCLLKRKE